MDDEVTMQTRLSPLHAGDDIGYMTQNGKDDGCLVKVVDERD